LANGGLATQSGFDRYAVTFVENHDMQDRGNVSNYTKDPITKNVAAANAWLLAMPGTPCVFLLHWKSYKDEIKQMILARKAAGITNQSTFTQVSSAIQYYEMYTTGAKAKLYAVFGNKSFSGSDYVKILSGTNYAYYLEKKAETPWVSLAEDTYTDPMEATLTAVSQTADAKLVYTLDGSDPTVSSTQVSSGAKITISETCTLKVGLLIGGVVKNIITRHYTIKPFEPHKATIYLKNPGWTTVYFYAWANDGNNTQLLGNWPGTPITTTKEIDGYTWYCYEFNVNTKDYSFNIIFNQGSGKKQTVDIGPLSEDTYYEIGAEVGGKFTVNDVTGTVTAITPITFNNRPNTDNNWYDLNGRRLTGEPTTKGVYIYQGKKILR
jgi:alpha-amylase